MTYADDLSAGAHNLLVNCAALTPSDRLLIVHEDPVLGWYDTDVAEAVGKEAARMGLVPTMLRVGAPGNTKEQRVLQAIAEHDCTIFFARIGDQDRFAAPVPGKKSVMVYARDAAMLASRYGRTDFRATYALKEAINDVLLSAARITITCPLGTEYSGEITDKTRENAGDVSVVRFPLGVPQPMDASGFSGRVTVARFLTPTGSKVYDPPSVALERPVMADVANGRIVRFTGDTDMVAKVDDHYNHVAGLFGIDRTVVHSWHAGMHPGCAYTMDAAKDPDRWSNTVFTNPRFLHLHTCGAYAPGEVCIMLLDHSVDIDGVKLWDRGRLRPEAFAQTQACLDAWPELTDLFADPSDAIGLPGE